MKQDGVTTTNNINEAGSFADFGTWMPKHVGGFTLDARYCKNDKKGNDNF